jgi:hypothetical protein
MKKINIMIAVTAPLLMLVLTLPTYADSAPAATCKDGTTSTATGRGACSSHGGVQKAAPAAPAAAATAPAAMAPAATPAPAGASSKSSVAAAGAPAGATAKCKDGTYSTAKSHSGACSKHGGVADWLTAN